MADDFSAKGQHYKLVSIQRSEPPDGEIGSNWYRYVIAFEGTNNIFGCRQGRLDSLISVVEENVAQLNERHTGKIGRAHLARPSKNVQN